MPRLSVIIPTLNERRNIQAAIQSAWQFGADEVIVVDGGSRDETVRLATECATCVLPSAPGRGRQQNRGAEASSGDVLLFQHADCRLCPQGSAQVAQWLADPTHTHGAFRQRIEADGWKYRLLQRGNAARVRWLGVAYGDQAIFVRRRAFEQVGGFADVPLMEDVELMKRLRPIGRPGLLPGPVRVSPRRWQQNGVIAQTARNWLLLTAFHLGVPPRHLVRFYPPHDLLGNGAALQPDSRTGSASGTKP